MTLFFNFHFLLKIILNVLIVFAIFLIALWISKIENDKGATRCSMKSAT